MIYILSFLPLSLPIIIVILYNTTPSYNSKTILYQKALSLQCKVMEKLQASILCLFELKSRI